MEVILHLEKWDENRPRWLESANTKIVSSPIYSIVSLKVSLSHILIALSSSSLTFQDFSTSEHLQMEEK